MEVSLLPVGRLAPQAQPVQCADHIATPHPMSDTQHRSSLLVWLLLASSSLVACGSLDGASYKIANLVTPYKMDIVQGNFVSKEQAAAIKPGMSRLQVRDILGTPLLTSIFHADRWDYVFTFKRQGMEPQSRKVTVFFKGDLLERMEAQSLPTEAEFVASIDTGRKFAKVPMLEMTEEGMRQLPAPTKKVEAKPLPPLPASYPPLEPAVR
jgi:outer membrane protein assembly factor BamE